jgi:ribosomal protein L40E
MFCPKCGTRNPETGKFCRSCGTDLSPVSEALTGKKNNKTPGFGITATYQPIELKNLKDKPITLENAFGKIFMGLAFFAVSIILAVTGMGKGWWFWMLIPAFGMLGSGLAHYIQLKKTERFQQNASLNTQPLVSAISSPPQNSALPPTQTEYVAPETRYKTGDLVPPSVTDSTTRHLEINPEGETMTLPKK